MIGSKLKRYRWHLLFLALAAAVVFVGMNALAPAQDQKEAADTTPTTTIKTPIRLVKVEVMEVQPTEVRDVLVLPGETKPWQDVRVAADQSGRIESVQVKEGDLVAQGDLLVEIDVSALKAVLDNAKADYTLANQNYLRRLKLFDRDIISREELEQFRTQMVVKEGMVRQAEVNYEHGFVRAPIAGRINHLYVDEGEFAAVGNPVADIVNVDKIEIELHVPELDVRYLEAGQKVMIRVDAFPTMPTVGVIDFVSFKGDSGTKTFATKVIMDNPGHKVRAGMIARVALQRRIVEDALVAPLFSIVDKNGERLVFVEENGVAHSRNISPGIIDGDRIQIAKGLEVGDRLIVTGQTEVEEGTKVEVVNETTTVEYLPSKTQDWIAKQMSAMNN